MDFDVQIVPGRTVRRWFKPQARFLLDNDEPFFPLPADQAAPMFEWGLNWCVAHRPLGYLVMHAAVLEKDGRALILPGFPGAGKSTLCASLAFVNGWRLLSDELAILDPATGLLLPSPRPVSLKNASIPIVARFPGARLGRTYVDTRKGTITHAAVPAASFARGTEPALPAWVVFPQFKAESPLAIDAVPRAEAFTWISEQSFNNERMGEVGFRSLCGLLDRVQCWEMSYGSTASGLEGIERICA